MKYSFSRWLVTSSALGLFVPVGWFLIQAVARGNTALGKQIAYPAERVIRLIWPSSFWLMATDGIEGTPRAYLFVFLSVLANIVLYALLGIAFWSVNRLTTSPRE